MDPLALADSGQFRFEIWPTEYRKITQHFGANPQNYAQFGLPGHEGVDIRAPSGSKVFCVAPGQVTQVHTDPDNHNYGIHVRVQHREGYVTIYAHLQEALVVTGQQVLAGTVLGLADNTGNSFGSHLHLTLKKNNAHFGNWPRNIIDPTPFLLPLLGWQEPVGPFVDGWVLTTSIVMRGNLAQVNPGGAALRLGPGHTVPIPEGTILVVSGKNDQAYTPVKVASTAVGHDVPTLPVTPAPPPPANVATIDGWGWLERLHIVGNQAVVDARHGINLRTEPHQKSVSVGIVRAGSTGLVLGEPENGYLPMRVRRADFMGPTPLTPLPPVAAIHDLNNLPEGVYLGWVRGHFLQHNPPYAQVRHRGASMVHRPAEGSKFIGVIKGDTAVVIAGQERNGFTPVLVRMEFMTGIVGEYDDVELPDGLSAEDSVPAPISDAPHTTPGWVLTGDIRISGDTAQSHHPLTLRAHPRRNGSIIGTVPVLTPMWVMGLPLGEFTPVRIKSTAVTPYKPNDPLDENEPGVYGQARIGLHASADPAISEAEHQEFALLKPGIIKALSFHSAEDISRLASAHPKAVWIIRAFLDFGGRAISPEQFVTYTLDDVKRALTALAGKQVVVELHNEPNIDAEGLFYSWPDGAAFARWFLDVLSRYRQALPGTRFIYPGLSPGSSVSGKKMDHIQFIEASRTAVQAADGLGVHLYWSNVYPQSRALDVLDDYITRFRNTPIWITEASNNKGGVTAINKAQEYLQFWHELQNRPIVQGVTYFVASASNPAFAPEVWVGQGIGRIVGAR